MGIFQRMLLMECITILLNLKCTSAIHSECIDRASDHYNTDQLEILFNATVPGLDNSKRKGDAGKICVIGGSLEYTGAPYFSAITSLKVGADLVFIITTQDAAPVIKSYSPELIVYPYLSHQYADKIPKLLERMDMVIIGPGLGREASVMTMTSEIISTCRILKKPMIIDADGLYFISRNLSLIENYPPPGVILLPNEKEKQRIVNAMNKTGILGFDHLGTHTSVLLKGRTDRFISPLNILGWSVDDGGSGRRAGGQGDILAGAVGTLFTWGLKSNICENYNVAASIATYGAAKLTRKCNEKAFELYGRSMIATDMLEQIHGAFEDLFGNMKT